MEQLHEFFKPVNISLKASPWLLELEPSLAPAICQSPGFVRVWDDFRKTELKMKRQILPKGSAVFCSESDPASEKCWSVALHCLACVLKLQRELASCKHTGEVVCHPCGVELGSRRNTGCLNSKCRALLSEDN